MARLTPKLRQEVREYINGRLEATLEFYTRGEAVDCPELRKNVAADVRSILQETAKKYQLKPIPDTFGVEILNGVICVKWYQELLN